MPLYFKKEDKKKMASMALNSSQQEASAESPRENTDPKVICVLGAGSFGTSMAFVAARRGNKVRIYARNQEQVSGVSSWCVIDPDFRCCDIYFRKICV